MTNFEHRDSERDAAVEARLVASRPAPSDDFVKRLQARLFAPAPASQRTPWGSLLRRRSWRPALAGGLATAGIAGGLLAFGLVGGGPLAPGGQNGVRAIDHCRYVSVTRRERVPVIAEGRHGLLELQFRGRNVQRQVKRCG